MALHAGFNEVQIVGLSVQEIRCQRKNHAVIAYRAARSMHSADFGINLVDIVPETDSGIVVLGQVIKRAIKRSIQQRLGVVDSDQYLSFASTVVVIDEAGSSGNLGDRKSTRLNSSH